MKERAAQKGACRHARGGRGRTKPYIARFCWFRILGLEGGGGVLGGFSCSPACTGSASVPPGLGAVAAPASAVRRLRTFGSFPVPRGLRLLTAAGASGPSPPRTEDELPLVSVAGAPGLSEGRGPRAGRGDGAPEARAVPRAGVGVPGACSASSRSLGGV